MDLTTFIEQTLDECKRRLYRTLQGLTAAELMWRPGPESNSIGFMVWHVARVEERWLHRFAQDTAEVWQRDGWYQKLGLPAAEHGFGYTTEQIAHLPQFDIEDCMAYHEVVRLATLRYLDGLTHADLARCPDPERRPGYTIGRMLSHLIVEESQHLGQVVYLRGLQRGLEHTTSWPNTQMRR